MQHIGPSVLVATIAVMGSCVGCETAGGGTMSRGPAAPMTQETTEEIDHFRMMTEPGEPHRLLDTVVGRWDVSLRIFGRDGADDVTGTGTVERRWILGGRFIESRPRMEGAQGSMEGVGILGYNAFDGVYEHVWVEDHATSMAVSRGHFDPERKQLVFRGQERDLSTGFVLATRTVHDLSSASRHTVTGFSTDQFGIERRIFEAVFERASP